MKLLHNTLMCAALLSSIYTNSMDNDNNRTISAPVPVRESRALLDASTRQQALQALEGSPKSPRTSARAILEEVRSARTLLPVSKKYQEHKTALLLAEKNIAHQLELLAVQKDNQALLARLNDLLSEARLAIIQAQSALEDDSGTARSYHTSENYSPRASGQDVESLLAKADRISADYHESRSPGLSENRQLSDATSDLEEVIARTNRTLASVRQSLNKIRERHTTEPTLSPAMTEEQKLGIALIERVAANEPTKAYDTFLAFFHEHPTFLIGTLGTTNIPLLHQGLNRLCIQPSAQDYILFTAMLEFGLDRDVLNSRGQTLLEVAMESNNEMLIQLLTLEKITKEALFSLACEHSVDELMPYFLE